MIRISTEQLQIAAALGNVRRRPTRSTGSASASRFHHLSYAGEPYLTFATTDFRVSMVSRLAVEGDGDAWEGQVPYASFNAFASTVEGGKLTLNPSSHRCLRAEKFSIGSSDALGREFFFTYPFDRVSNPAPYPTLELLDVLETSVVRLAPLRNALAFATPATSETDSETRLSTCTVTESGEVTACAGRVFFRSVADAPGFALNLPSPDAGRLGAWLGLIDPPPAAEIEVATGTDAHRRVTHQFRTRDHAHTFRVLAAPRPVPTEFVQAVRQTPPAITGTVRGQPLYEIARYFRQFKGCPLRCHFRGGAGGWRIHLTSTGEVPEGGGPVALDDCQILDAAAAAGPLHVSPSHLHVALGRHRRGRLRLAYHPQARTLAFTSTAGPAGEGSADQSLVRVSPASEPAP